ncbi:MAG: hypothetical protein WC108_00560 [Bacteroidales bacterium]
MGNIEKKLVTIDGIQYLSIPKRDYRKLRSLTKDTDASAINEYMTDNGEFGGKNVYLEYDYFKENESLLFDKSNPIYDITQKYEEEYISNKPEVESNVESNVDVPSPISTDVKPSGVNADGQQRTAILDDGQHVKLSYGPDGTAQSIAITEEEYNTIAQNNDKALGVTTNPEGNKIVAQNIIDEEEVPVEKVRKGTVDVDGEDEVTIADPTALDSTKPKNNVANDITEKKSNEDDKFSYLRETFEKDLALAEKAKNWGNAKSVFDLAMNTEQLIKNAMGGTPDTVTPTLAPIPSIPSSKVVQEQKLREDASMAQASAVKGAREAGREDLVSGITANTLSAVNSGSASIAGNELERQVQQASLQSQVQGANAQMENQTKLYNDDKLAKAAAGLSEVNANLLSNYSTIAQDFIDKNIESENAQNASLTWLAMLKSGISSDEIEKAIAKMYASNSRDGGIGILPRAAAGKHEVKNPTP